MSHGKMMCTHQTGHLHSLISLGCFGSLATRLAPTYYCEASDQTVPSPESLVDACTFELPHDKTNKMASAPNEDSDQPGYPLSPISLRCPQKESSGP